MSEEEWEPPTEAELKVLEKRRERSELISKLMGSYLLKGYKMLDADCPACRTVLLESRDKVRLCVSCVDLASDTCKDDPALSQQAADSLLEENRQKVARRDPQNVVCNQVINQSLNNSIKNPCENSIKILEEKINAISENLARKSNPIVLIQLADTIKHLADAAKSLKDMQK